MSFFALQCEPSSQRLNAYLDYITNRHFSFSLQPLIDEHPELLRPRHDKTLKLALVQFPFHSMTFASPPQWLWVDAPRPRRIERHFDGVLFLVTWEDFGFECFPLHSFPSFVREADD